MSKLERATHICLIGLSVIAGGLLLERRFAPPRPASPASGSSSVSLVGKHLDVPGLNWKASRLNAVLFMNTHCHFCKESMPFYKRLAGVKQAEQAGFTFSVLSSERAGDVKAFLSKEGVAVDGVYQADSAAGLRSTPTLLLVDGSGSVRRVFVGALDASRQERVLSLVRAGGA